MTNKVKIDTNNWPPSKEQLSYWHNATGKTPRATGKYMKWANLKKDLWNSTLVITLIGAITLIKKYKIANNAHKIIHPPQ